MNLEICKDGFSLCLTAALSIIWMPTLNGVKWYASFATVPVFGVESPPRDEAIGSCMHLSHWRGAERPTV